MGGRECGGSGPGDFLRSVLSLAGVPACEADEIINRFDGTWAGAAKIADAKIREMAAKIAEMLDGAFAPPPTFFSGGGETLRSGGTTPPGGVAPLNVFAPVGEDIIVSGGRGPVVGDAGDRVTVVFDDSSLSPGDVTVVAYGGVAKVVYLNSSTRMYDSVLLGEGFDASNATVEETNGVVVVTVPKRG